MRRMAMPRLVVQQNNNQNVKNIIFFFNFFFGGAGTRHKFVCISRNDSVSTARFMTRVFSLQSMQI